MGTSEWPFKTLLSAEQHFFCPHNVQSSPLLFDGTNVTYFFCPWQTRYTGLSALKWCLCSCRSSRTCNCVFCSVEHVSEVGHTSILFTIRLPWFHWLITNVTFLILILNRPKCSKLLFYLNQSNHRAKVSKNNIFFFSHIKLHMKSAVWIHCSMWSASLKLYYCQFFSSFVVFPFCFWEKGFTVLVFAKLIPVANAMLPHLAVVCFLTCLCLMQLILFVVSQV